MSLGSEEATEFWFLWPLGYYILVVKSISIEPFLLYPPKACGTKKVRMDVGQYV